MRESVQRAAGWMDSFSRQIKFEFRSQPLQATLFTLAFLGFFLSVALPSDYRYVGQALLASSLGFQFSGAILHGFVRAISLAQTARFEMFLLTCLALTVFFHMPALIVGMLAGLGIRALTLSL